MLETGMIGIGADAPVSAHSTTDALRASLRELFTVRLRGSIDLTAESVRADFAPTMLQSIREGYGPFVDSLTAVREARVTLSNRRILADADSTQTEQQALIAYASMCDTLQSRVDSAIAAIREGSQRGVARHMNEAWFLVDGLERDWLRAEYQQILNDPLSEKNIPADPYRWVLNITPPAGGPATKGLAFERLHDSQVAAERWAGDLQRNVSEFSRKIRAGEPGSAADLRSFAGQLEQAAKLLAGFLPLQSQRIDIYFNQLLRDLPQVDGKGVDPIVYVFTRDLCTLKQSALDKLATDVLSLGAVSVFLDRVARKSATVGSIDSSLQDGLREAAEELEFLSVSAAARVRLSNPLFLGTQRSYDQRGPFDPLIASWARQAAPLGGQGSYFETWSPGPMQHLIDSRLPADSINVAMRAAGYGTREEGILWPMYVDQARDLMHGDNGYARWLSHIDGGASRFRTWVPTPDGMPFGVWQYEGHVAEDWKIVPQEPQLPKEVLDQTKVLQEHARLELNDKGTTLGNHSIVDRMTIEGAKFVTLETLDRREVGFCYMFVDQDYFPDREEIEQIPRHLLPEGRPARPNLIVIDEEVSRQVENGEAYSRIMTTMENIARESGCDYMIARVNLHEGSRGWKAAERRGWRKIDAFASSAGSVGGTTAEIRQQWILKDLY